MAALSAELDLAVQKERSPEQYQNAIHNALQDSQRVIKLIDGLLNLAKADYEPEQIKREEIRLDELLLDARELVLRAYPDFHVELVFEQEAEDDKVLTVIGNSYLLTTAFVNLIENNCKYSRNQTSLSRFLSGKNGPSSAFRTTVWACRTRTKSTCSNSSTVAKTKMWHPATASA